MSVQLQRSGSGVLWFCGSAVLVHPGLPPAPHDLWSAWNWSVPLILALLVLAAVYARGITLLWQRAGRGRGVRVWQAACYAAGLFTLAIALISPLDALGSALFSAHMAQHTLLTLVAAPLLVLGRPWIAWAWAVDGGATDGGRRTEDGRTAGGAETKDQRPKTKAAPQRRTAQRSALIRTVRFFALRRSGSAVGSAGTPFRGLVLPTAFAIHALALLLWHVPLFYAAALHNETVHVFEHAVLFGSALLFWWAVGVGRGARRTDGQAALALFGMALVSSLISALILAARTPWFVQYAQGAPLWGLTPLEDQGFAAVLMMIPCDIIYGGAALALLARWLRTDERVSGQIVLSESRR